MAKWGEGDPRWIVEERPDATNVNNWHWTEKNASDWSKTKLDSLFKDIIFYDSDIGTAVISDITKCEGEATANNRKGKLFFFYDWTVEMDWKMLDESVEKDEKTDDKENKESTEEKTDDKVNKESTEEKGKLIILNLSEENEPHEIDIEVSVTSGSDKADKMKEYIRVHGIQQIRDKAKSYLEALKAEYATNLILPTKDKQVQTKHSKTIITKDLANNVKNIRVSSPPSSSGNGTPLEMKEISLSQTFKCTADELFRVFTVQEMAAAFTRDASVRLEASPGGEFVFFSGNVHGKFVLLEQPTRLEQTWRFKSWPEGHFSQVTICITQEENETRLDLTQKQIPANDVERTRQGWQNYYWDSIKRTFGFGAHLI